MSAAESGRKKHRVLKCDGGRFMCTADRAVDVAYMVSCAEGLITQHRDLDRLQLGELIVEYLDGNASTDDVRAELKDWAKELANESAGRRALAEAPTRDDGGDRP